MARLVGADENLIPSGESIAFGKFIRDGLEIYIMDNTSDQNYTGKLNVQKGKWYLELDPQSGEVSKEQKLREQTIPVCLAPLQTRLFIVG